MSKPTLSEVSRAFEDVLDAFRRHRDNHTQAERVLLTLVPPLRDALVTACRVVVDIADAQPCHNASVYHLDEPAETPAELLDAAADARGWYAHDQWSGAGALDRLGNRLSVGDDVRYVGGCEDVIGTVHAVSDDGERVQVALMPCGASLVIGQGREYIRAGSTDTVVRHDRVRS